MSIWEYYLQFLGELCEGKREYPAGITKSTSEDEMQRIMELQGQIMAMGIPAFVKLCADADGIEIAQEEYDSFDMDEMISAMSAAMTQNQGEEGSEESAEVTEAEQPPLDPEEPRHPFEILLDCVCLDDKLLAYLIDVLKREDWKEFYKISQITTHMDLDPKEFLIWLGNKELYADEDERNCAVLMDNCFERLINEGQAELLAALLSGDQKTFEVFRTEAPELVHVPDATYEWYCKNYLDRFYPVRCFMAVGGVKFPKVK